MFRHILHATDFTAAALRSFAHSVALAQRTGADIAVVHALTQPDYDERLVQESSAALSRAVDRVQADLEERASHVLATPAGPPVEVVVRRGSDPAGVVLDVARERGSDLIVVGTSAGAHPRQLLMGSVAERIARVAPCPVLVISGDEPPAVRLHHVVLGVDFAAVGTAAVAAAGGLARLDGAVLHAVHVFEQMSVPEFYPEAAGLDDSLRQRARTALAEHVARHAGSGFPLSCHVREGRVVAELLAVADEQAADLVVVAQQGRAAIDPPGLGGVTARVLRRSRRPVLVCPA